MNLLPPPSPFLLTDPSVCLRHLSLLELFAPDGEDEAEELGKRLALDPMVSSLVQFQRQDGSWDGQSFGGGWGASSRTLATAWAMMRLGYLGFGSDFDPVRKGAEYLFHMQQEDGGWPLSRGADVGDEKSPEVQKYSMIPLQTSLPLRGLAACGYATDPRCERAYEWLIRVRLEDGAWPTGEAAGVHGYVAGYRRLAHSRWGCRSNTTGALACLVLHPQRRFTEATLAGLDHLLGRETRDEFCVGFEAARLAGMEPPRGFITFYARFDLAQLLDFCWRTGASLEDARVKDLVDFVIKLRGEFGLWNYEDKPQATRWVSFDLTRSLMRIPQEGWAGSQPRTPFQPYPRRIKRF